MYMTWWILYLRKRRQLESYPDLKQITVKIVTSSVKVEGGTLAAVSVKTKEDIPKGKIFDCVTALKDVVVKAPVHIGDVVLADVAGTGVDVIATKNVL